MYTCTHIHTFVHACKYAKFIKSTLIHIPILIPRRHGGRDVSLRPECTPGQPLTHSLIHSLHSLTPLTPLHSTPLHSLAHSTHSLLSLTCAHSLTQSLTDSLTPFTHSLTHCMYACMYAYASIHVCVHVCMYVYMHALYKNKFINIYIYNTYRIFAYIGT